MQDDFPVIELDELTSAIYLLVPKDQVVNLQAYFELYEGLGTIRTVSIKNSLICIVCTNDNIHHCQQVLLELKDDINWRLAPSSLIKEDDYLESYGQKMKRQGKIC